ncbi:MAG TPA: SMI1/KNR4 family protein [Chitinophagaceae bacterium]|nr:SMI1/KNR4 family protein [Chitinophagaceae bacterium]
MDTLEKLKSLNQSVPNPATLPAEADVKAAEEKLGIKFPPSYVKYQLEYSDVSFGHLEMYSLMEDGGYLDLIQAVNEARQYHQLPEHLLPFAAEQDGDYFCFDLQSEAPEYEVVYWSHNGTTDEGWQNFLDWVERCWIEEQAE